jgi:hypothetical protein
MSRKRVGCRRELNGPGQQEWQLNQAVEEQPQLAWMLQERTSARNLSGFPHKSLGLVPAVLLFGSV